MGLDAQGVISFWNPGATRLFGYEEAEILGQPISRLIPPAQREEAQALLRRVAETGPVSGYETLRMRKDGAQIEVAMSVSPIRLPGTGTAGRLIGYAAIIRDNSERRVAEQRMRELQAELLQASRLSALGEVAATIIHEVNQPLAAISNYLGVMEHALRGTAPDDPIRAVLAHTAAQVERAVTVVRRLRGLAMPMGAEPMPEAFNLAVAEAAEMALAGLDRTGLNVTLDLSPAVGLVRMDRVQVTQLVVNLVRNAAEAIGGGARREIRIATARPRPDGVELRVYDNGPGLPQAVRARLFQPFVTGKPGGIGLGLAICHRIAHDHAGTLDLQEGEDGTCFLLALPAADAA